MVFNKKNAYYKKYSVYIEATGTTFEVEYIFANDKISDNLEKKFLIIIKLFLFYKKCQKRYLLFISKMILYIT